MELPSLGQHCSQKDCNKLDFLPIKCDACSLIFCNEHYFYTNHNCTNAYQKNNQVPVCPLCNQPIPLAKGQQPDLVVGEHIDNDCQAVPSKNKPKVFKNRCSLKGCKVKEIIPVLCNDCSQNYCLKHRHPQDHKCEGKLAVRRNQSLQAAVLRQNGSANINDIHGNMSEDEALARALALSMQEPTNKSKYTQEESDHQLARQLQTNLTSPTTRRTRDTCNLC